MATIHGEIVGQSTLVVLAGGLADPEELALAAKKLKALTPLFSKSDPPGALIVELTWPCVVQLAEAFGPDWLPSPDLAAWITDQVMQRTTAGGIDYRPPAGLTPYPWQTEGAAIIAGTGRALITDEPGTGKTITTILGLVEWADSGRLGEIGPVIVVCPASVIDAWVEAWRNWAPHVRAIAWRGTPTKRRALAGTADVYVCSYETARVDAPAGGTKSMKPLLGLDAAALVVDECFPAGTSVSTPTGPRAIEDLDIGDEVIGVDHQTGKPVVTTVRHTFNRLTDEPLTTVNGVAMTPNHPVWTDRGYVPAGSVVSDDKVCATLINCTHDDLHADLRMVRADVDEDRVAPTSVLQPGVLGEMAYVQPGVRRVARHPEEACRCVTEHASVAREPGGSGHPVGAPARTEQPATGPCRTSEVPRHVGGSGLAVLEGRERSDHGTTEALGRSAGLVRGGTDPHGASCAVPEGLQSRPGRASTDDRDRGGRVESPVSQGAGVGRQAGRAAGRPGLDATAVPQPGGPDGRRVGAEDGAAGRRVFNVETGTGNYLAGGLLVHNCHLIKNNQTGRSQAVRRIAHKVTERDGAVVCLSGTPITHHPGDLWASLDALEHNAWPSRTRWVARYCMTIAGEYGDEILGLLASREPEFRTTLLGQHRRVAKADVLSQLPPKVYSVRTVDLPREWRKAYDDMESQMLAELPDGEELSVMGVLAQMTRLAQLASAPADVAVTTEITPEGLEKVHTRVTLKAPSWKVAALLEILEERPGQPVVCFAPSRQLMQLAGQAAAEAGMRVGYIVGGQAPAERTRAVDEFQAGQLELICATTGAGGVGLTLTAARTVVFLQRPWSLVESIQAEDRCHRIGSEVHDSIEVIDVVARNTLDTRIRAVLRERAGQLADLVQDPRVLTTLLGGTAIAERATQASPAVHSPVSDIERTAS